MDECDLRLSEPLNFPDRELAITQKELNIKIKATDNLMDKIETSINLEEELKLKDVFNVLQLDARIDKITLGSEERFHLARRM